MSLSFCVLASGSSGNSTLVALEGPQGTRHVLIDCGLSLRATAARLAPLGLGIEDVSAVLLTHFDGDHFSSAWAKHVGRERIDVHLHRSHRNRAARLGLDGRVMRLFGDSFLFHDATVEPVLLAHDALGTVGFIVEHMGVRLGFATDLGHVPPSFADRFRDLHALAIESNYDPALQAASDRPRELKRRITGGRGHLSNDQSLDAVLAIDARSNLRHVVPLHLSRQCNDPRLVKSLYSRRAPHLVDRLTLTSQYRATPLLGITDPADTPHGVRPGEQLAMFEPCPSAAAGHSKRSEPV